jgi:hypothetical protein
VPVVHVQCFNVHAVTGATNWEGKRVSNRTTSGPHRCPGGHAFNKDTLKAHLKSQGGSEHGYEVEWSDYVEIVPGSGFMAPTSLTVTAHARSGKGHYGGKGWIDVDFEVSMIELPGH